MACSTSLLWSMLPILLKAANVSFSPLFIVWWRFAVAFVCMLVVLRLRSTEALRILFQPPKLALCAGIALAGNYYGYTMGIALSGASTAAILIQSGGLSLTLLGIFIFKERLTRVQISGFIVASAGLFMFFLDRSGQSADVSLYRWGSVATIAAGVSWGIYASLIKHNRGEFSAHELNLLVFGVGTAAFLPLLRFAEFAQVTPAALLLLVVLGLITFLGYTTLAEALRSLPAAETSILISINPLLTLVLMHILMVTGVNVIVPEPISWFGYLGALGTIFGVVLVMVKKKPEAIVEEIAAEAPLH